MGSESDKRNYKAFKALCRICDGGMEKYKTGNVRITDFFFSGSINMLGKFAGNKAHKSI
jgi:hypothetical protein